MPFKSQTPEANGRWTIYLWSLVFRAVDARLQFAFGQTSLTETNWNQGLLYLEIKPQPELDIP